MVLAPEVQIQTQVMSTVLSHFSGLHGLIQIIYRGTDRFVALSQVTESGWSVSLALKGPEGRWWRSLLSAQHISKMTVRVRPVLIVLTLTVYHSRVHNLLRRLGTLPKTFERYL